MESNIEKAEAFLESSFAEHPNYSFGDGTIMSEHSKTVRDVAMQIGESVSCDSELLQIMALFHDIGKAHEADAQTLRERHDELGYDVAKDFLPDLELTAEQHKTLVAFLKGDFSSVEASIIKDADIIAFFLDERLQKALKDWGDAHGLPNELQRKADKITKLHFAISTSLATSAHDAFIKKWGIE